MINDGQLSGRHRQLVHNGPVESLAFSPDGSILASGETRHGIKLWSVETDRERIELPTEDQYIIALEFSADGRRLIAARPKGVIQLWNLEDRRGLATIKGRSDFDFCAANSPNGRFVARGGEDGIVRVWDLDAFVTTPSPEGDGFLEHD
jgi:WD40 repeat protein